MEIVRAVIRKETFMKSSSITKPLALIVLTIVAAGGVYLTQDLWLPKAHENASQPAAAPDETGPADKVLIVGEQAQQNLDLKSKPAKAGVFWKSIAVQGMVVDRPGVSDLEVVAPTTCIVNRIFFSPGETVRPGDDLFMLKLASETVHAAQTDLFKASQNIILSQERLKRLVDAGEGIPQSRVLELKQEITRLEVEVKSVKHELAARGFSVEDIENVVAGRLINEIPVKVPNSTAGKKSSGVAFLAISSSGDAQGSVTFELQSLHVEVGEQIDAGDKLCTLSNHQMLAIEGRAFRDETMLLERSIQEGWPVEVDFQESSTADWPPLQENFLVRHISNNIDPVSRTFAFLIPLENQSKTVGPGNATQLLWRFRPGQKVRLHIRTEKLNNVFVLPSDAVVREGADTYVFTQNVNTFERKQIHVVYQDRDHMVIANDGTLPTFVKDHEPRTFSAIVQNAAPQLNRMTKSGSTEVPKGFHIHADGSLHKNEDEAKK